MANGDLCAVAMIHSLGVDTAGLIFVACAIGYDPSNVRILSDVGAINDNAEIRRFDDRFFPELYLVT